MVKILIGHKYCQTFERKDFEMFLVGQKKKSSNKCAKFQDCVQLHP